MIKKSGKGKFGCFVLNFETNASRFVEQYQITKKNHETILPIGAYKELQMRPAGHWHIDSGRSHIEFRDYLKQ